MNRSVINGITIEGNHKSVVIKNGQVYIDGELVSDTGYQYTGPIVINGNVGKVDGTTIEINGNVTGDVDGATITINGDVLGDVDGATVKIMGEKKSAKSSDIADTLYAIKHSNSCAFDLDEYDSLEKQINEKIEVIKNRLFEAKPELEETFRRADKIAEAFKKEDEVEATDLKELVKRNKKKKKR